jgi:hypothetical protein
MYKSHKGSCVQHCVQCVCLCVCVHADSSRTMGRSPESQSHIFNHSVYSSHQATGPSSFSNLFCGHIYSYTRKRESKHTRQHFNTRLTLPQTCVPYLSNFCPLPLSHFLSLSLSLSLARAHTHTDHWLWRCGPGES